MAQNKRGRHYKMTPRRKAALAKAQAASARKRRRRVGRAAGLAGATLAVGTMAYLGHRKLSNRPKGPGKALVHVPGQGHTHVQYSTTVVKTKPRKNPKNKPHGPKMWKVDSNGDVTVTRFRGHRTPGQDRQNYKKRRKYWAAKPVGGAPRKKYTSTKRGRK